MTKRTSRRSVRGPQDVQGPGPGAPRRDDDYVEFVNTHWTKFLRLAALLSGDDHRGEELLQDCLVKLYVRWQKPAVHDDPAAYLQRMLVNGNIDWWRRTKRERLTDSVPERPHHQSAGPLLDEDLRRALCALPKGQRAVIVLRYCEDLTERETAGALGCSIGTVKSQNARAMASLRKRLAPRPVMEGTETK